MNMLPDVIDDINSGIDSIVRELDTRDSEARGLGNRMTSYRLGLGFLSQANAELSSTIRDLAIRFQDMEIALSKEYLANKLSFGELLPTFGDLSFRDFVVLMPESPDRTVCDIFGPDQLGVRAKLIPSGTGANTGSALVAPSDNTLHFGVGVSLTSSPPSLYLSQRALIRGPAFDLSPRLVEEAQTQINRALNEKLPTVSLPLPNIDFFGALDIQYFALKAQTFLSIFGRIKDQELCQRGIPQTPPSLPVLANMSDGIHAAIRLRSSKIVDLLADRFIEEIRNNDLTKNRILERVEKAINSEPAFPVVGNEVFVQCHLKFSNEGSLSLPVAIRAIFTVEEEGKNKRLFLELQYYQPFKGVWETKKKDEISLGSDVIEIVRDMQEDFIKIFITYDIKQKP